MKFGEGPYSYQQKVYAMRGFSVAIKSSFLISFSNVGQSGAGRAKHFAALHFLALLFPALHKLKRWLQWCRLRGQ